MAAFIGQVCHRPSFQYLFTVASVLSRTLCCVTGSRRMDILSCRRFLLLIWHAVPVSPGISWHFILHRQKVQVTRAVPCIVPEAMYTSRSVCSLCQPFTKGSMRTQHFWKKSTRYGTARTIQYSKVSWTDKDT